VVGEWEWKEWEAGHLWLMPVILATWEVEIKRIEV
jgi:hypothetical protein